ncbi:helix-turn-helix transcriptional regulator [bacterium]|nr:helix-turn-helix transcriptional regulator [bacterium]
MEIELVHIGIGTSHGDDFVYSRPGGVGATWVFMLLPVALEIDTHSGREISRAGDCILHDPGFPQMHRALPGGFHNDWMHFRGRQVPSLLRECQVPMNELLRIASTDFIRVGMRELQREFSERGLHWRRRSAALTADLFWQLSRRLNAANEKPATRAEREHQQRLGRVRAEVLANLGNVWTVAEMAGRANLSEARFSALYRKIFGSSPNEELIRARVEHAQFLLAHTSLPIKAVAGKCGFESVPYFSRAFHRRVGCAPRDYLRVPLKLAADTVG